MRDRLYHYRRRCGGGPGGRTVSDGKCSSNLVCDALLVLRNRDFRYGSEHHQAVWGFNGTERPGAVYLAAVMAAHAQRGLPAFSIYGHDVQDAKDTTIPADVLEKSYVSPGSCGRRLDDK